MRWLADLTVQINLSLRHMHMPSAHANYTIGHALSISACLLRMHCIYCCHVSAHLPVTRHHYKAVLYVIRKFKYLQKLRYLALGLSENPDLDVPLPTKK